MQPYPSYPQAPQQYPQYQPVPRVSTAPGERPKELPWRLAGWWSRVGAQLLDLLIVWIPAGLLLGGLVVAVTETGRGGTRDVLLGVMIFASLIVMAAHYFYAPLLMRRRGERNGQTWGKQVAGIRVIRADGNPMSFADAAMRQIVIKGFGMIVASTLVPLFPWVLNYLWPTWDEQNRALHDVAADTRVVRA